MSRRKTLLGTPLPFTSLAESVITDCELPFCVMVSGCAASENDSASSDGPVNPGVSVEETVHAVPSSAIDTARNFNGLVIRVAMSLEVPKVPEVDLNRPRDADFVADAIRPVERDIRDRREDLGGEDQCRQRSFLFGAVANELEGQRELAADLHGAGGGPVKWPRHVDTWLVPAVRALVDDVEPRDGDFIVGRRRRRHRRVADV